MKLPTALSSLLDHGIPGRARLRYVFGSGLLFAIVLQVATGIAMAFVYVPSAQQAYGSVAYLQQSVPLGRLIRGLHHFGASAVIVMAALHLLQVFLAGAYRPPRHVGWWSGLGLLGLLLGFSLTGYLLPWDQKGYWATQVATGIAGGMPVFGPALQRIVLGGATYGTATLTRFYALHTLLLPLGILLLLVPHLLSFMRHNVTAPPADRESGRQTTFWPLQAFYDLVCMATIAGILLLLAFFAGAPLDAPANPTGAYDARPEWYFLFLYQLLKYFEGPMVLVGTAVIPGLATIFLILLPWLDRARSVRLRERIWVLVPMAGLLGGILALTLLARADDATNPAYKTHLAKQEAEAAFALRVAPDGFTPQGTLPALEGRRLFARIGCGGCHQTQGQGGKKGPVLDAYASRSWFAAQLRNPDTPERFGNTKLRESMPSMSDLPEDQRRKLVTFLASRTGLAYTPELDPSEVKAGQIAFDEGPCSTCHTLDGTSMVGPSLQYYGSDDYIRLVLKNAGHEALYGEDNGMPRFDYLSEAQVNSLIAYLRALRSPAD